jgi:hypothetical protein
MDDMKAREIEALAYIYLPIPKPHPPTELRPPARPAGRLLVTGVIIAAAAGTTILWRLFKS